MKTIHTWSAGHVWMNHVFTTTHFCRLERCKSIHSPRARLTQAFKLQIPGKKTGDEWLRRSASRCDNRKVKISHDSRVTWSEFHSASRHLYHEGFRLRMVSPELIHKIENIQSTYLGHTLTHPYRYPESYLQMWWRFTSLRANRT